MSGEPDPEPRVDPEHPWPALLSFREDDQHFFGGRKEEVEALYRRIASTRLTLLFGLSGLGKTSLLRAGLFPRLRTEHYFPVYIRLRFGRDLPTPVEQIKSEIAAQARASHIEAPEPRDGETLWQYFHRPDADFWDERNYPSVPVLVFDQFEELFTKSRDVPELALEVVEELADLAEEQAFEKRYRLLIGIRSDYLAQLQAISDRVRAIFANRYELRRMSGAAALESTLTAGGHLLDEDVARRIVRFVAGAKDSDDSLPVEGLQVEPALLSLVCSELNATRIENREPKITASMLSGTKDEILSRFYETSFADVSPELRALVEDKLVTRDGKARNFISEQTARETAGVTEEDLAKLVHRRLLRFEESGSSRRMELTHDLLTAVAAASRGTREQRRQLEEAQRARAEAEVREASARRQLRRSRAAMLVFFVLLALVAAQFIAGRLKSIAADRAESESAFRLAVQKLTSDEPAEGLALLARAIRLDDDNAAARTLLYQQLVTRSWPVPVRTFGPDGRIDEVEFSEDGARVAFRFNRIVEMWDVARGQKIGRVFASVERSISFASDGWTVLFGDPPGDAPPDYPALWHPRTKRPTTYAEIGKLSGGCTPTHVFDVSANGDELLVNCGGVNVVSLRGERPMERVRPGYLFTGIYRFARDPRFIFGDHSAIYDRQAPEPIPRRHSLGGESLATISPDGKRVAIRRDRTDLEAWDVESWTSAGQRFNNQSQTRSVVFDGTGDTIMTTAEDDGIRVWNAEEGTRLFEPLWHPQVQRAAFSRDGARILTASERAACWWDAHSGKRLGAAIVQPKMLRAHLDARGNIVTVSTKATVWELGTVLLPPVLPGGVTPAGLSADRTVVVDGVIAGFEVATGKPLWKEVPQSTVAIDRQFSRVVVIEDERVSLVDLKSGKRKWTLAKNIRSAQFSDDGTAVALFEETSGPYPKRTIVSAADGKELAPPTDRGDILAESRDGLLFVLRSPASPSLRVWDIRRNLVLLNVRESEDATVDFSDDGRQLATVSALRGIRVWDIATGKERTAKWQDREKLTDPNFSADGRTLALRSENGAALCDVKTLDCGDDVLPHPGIERVDFSADGKRILTAGSGDVRVWDVETRQPLSVSLPLHRNRPVAGLSPDGAFVLSTDDDNELYRVPLPAIEDGDAEILASLGEALSGARVDRLGVITSVDGAAVLANLEQQCGDREGAACEIVQWLRTPAAKRSISPLSKLRLADYLKGRKLYPEDWWSLKARFPEEAVLGTAPPEE